MKKWIGTISSALAGILTMVFLAIPALTMKTPLGSENYSGWDILTDKAFADIDFTSVTWYRIFAWIMVVLAIILIVMAVLQLFANLKVIKMPAILSTINSVALIAIAIFAILTLIANFGIRAEFIDMFGGKEILELSNSKIVVNASLWLTAILNVITAVCGSLFAQKKA